MSDQRDNYQFLTAAPIPRVILTLAVPSIVTMLTSSLYSMVDTFFVGRLNTQATAAVGVSFAVLSVAQAVGFFFGHGSGNYISRQLGARQTEAARRMASVSFLLAILTGVLLGALGIALLTPLSRALGSTPTILPYTEDYLAVILLGTPLNIGSMVLNNQMRFQGNARLAMRGMVAGVALNVVLDPLLIFTCGLGVQGAAWATVMGQALSFGLLLWSCQHGQSLRIEWRQMRPSRHLVSEIARGGTPSLLRQGLGSVATLLLNLVAAGWGDAAIAAMSIVGRITFFVNSFIIGLGQGYQPLCGFSYGAGLYSRVRRGFWFCVRVGTAFLVVCAVGGLVFAGDVIQVFRDDPDVIRIGREAFILQLCTYPLSAFNMHSNMMMQTVGRTGEANLLAASRRGLFFIPFILLLPWLFGLRGLEACQPVCDVCAALLAFVIIRRFFQRELPQADAPSAMAKGAKAE